MLLCHKLESLGTVIDHHGGDMGKPRGPACPGASVSAHLQHADTFENGLSLMNAVLCD